MTPEYTYKNVLAQALRYTSVLPFVGQQFGMPKRPSQLSNTTRIFALNVNRLREHYKETPAAAARRCKVSQQQMDRFTKCQQSPTLDSVHKVARGYDVEAYQLLVPEFNPVNRPRAVAERLFNRLREISAQVRDLDSDGPNTASAPDVDYDPPRPGESKDSGRPKKTDSKTKTPKGSG